MILPKSFYVIAELFTCTAFYYNFDIFKSIATKTLEVRAFARCDLFLKLEN